jgi:hypothetical protein
MVTCNHSSNVPHFRSKKLHEPTEVVRIQSGYDSRLNNGKVWRERAAIFAYMMQFASSLSRRTDTDVHGWQTPRERELELTVGGWGNNS